MNTSSDQLVPIKNNLLSVTSMLPNSNTRPERQLEPLFGLGATLFSLYNYNYNNADNSQISKNTQYRRFTHLSEIQENRMKHQDNEVANNLTIVISTFNL
jgi:pyruvoyl-dependent arginine decarboxylase (PvlArgDC)